MKIHRAYKFKLLPTKEQEEFLCQSFGASRWIYNYFLNYKDTKYKTEGKNVSKYEMCRVITQLRKEENTSWLKEMNSQSLQQTVQDLDAAYIKFFKGQSKFPRFKNKNGKQSFHIPQFWKLKEDTVKIPKLKTPLKFIKHRSIEGEICSITISKSKTNKYFISFCCEEENNHEKTRDGEIGIDLGIKDLLVMSNGEKVKNYKFHKKNLKKLKQLQRHLSRKKKGSKRREKCRLKIAKTFEKITNSREDLYHKVSKDLTDRFSLICLESLNVKGMVKNHKLAASIQDCAWYSLISKIEYKAKWKRCKVVKIDQFYPSSKTCSVCNWKKTDLTLKDREWTCPNCGTNHDRDLNAAKNILIWGKRTSSFGTNEYSRGDEVKLKSPVVKVYRLRSDEKEEKKDQS